MTFAFIINPKAGTRSKSDIPKLINDVFEGIQYTIIETTYAGHATALAKIESEKGTNIVVAVGGDGTVNEVAQGLLHSRTMMGILPLGSGNGLARHLAIPMVLKSALEVIKSGKGIAMDVGELNEHLFLCTCGFGFDAKVAHEFAKQGSRGFFTYAKVALRNFLNYKTRPWEVSVNGGKKTLEGLIFTIANANQFGNDVFIAPQALLTDGVLDLCVLKKAPVLMSPLVLKDLFSKNIHRNRFYTDFQFQELTVANEGEVEAHVDGEPVLLSGSLNVAVIPKALNVITNQQLV